MDFSYVMSFLGGFALFLYGLQMISGGLETDTGKIDCKSRDWCTG